MLDRTRASARLIGFAVITAIGCGEATAPAVEPGFVYVLESVDGAPLPVDMHWTSGDYTFGPFTIAADTLWIGGSSFIVDRRTPTGGSVVGFWGLLLADGDSVSLHSSVFGPVLIVDGIPVDPPQVKGAAGAGQLTLTSLVDPETLPLPGSVLVYRRVNLPAPREQIAGKFVLASVDDGPVPDSIPTSPLSDTKVAFVAETLFVSNDRGYRRWPVVDPEFYFLFPRSGIVTASGDSVFMREPLAIDAGAGVVRRDGIELRAGSGWSFEGSRLWYRRVVTP